MKSGGRLKISGHEEDRIHECAVAAKADYIVTENIKRPSQVALATKLLAGSLAFSTFKMFDYWSRVGFEWVAGNRAAWFRPFLLALWAILIALTWKGNSWARTMIIVAIAWDALQTISTATLLFAIGGGGLLALLSWGNLAVELFAVYLLLQSESLDWFRQR